MFVHAVGLSLLTWAFGWTYRAGIRTEDLVVNDVLATGRPLKEGDHLFFINVPMLAYYAIPAIKNETSLRDLHGHMLTLSPWVLRMEQPSLVECVDDRTLVVTAPEGSPYFSGAGGRTLRTVMGFAEPFAAGDEIKGDQFDVRIESADAKGVRRLRFTFHKPLSSPEYHFYLGSPVRWAYAVFDAGRSGLTLSPRAPYNR